MKNYRNIFKATLLASLAILLAGCSADPPADISSYVDPEIHNVSRVVFVEIADQAGYPDIATRMTRSLAQAMTEEGIFRVDVLQAGHPELRYLDMDKREPLTLRELQAIRKTLRCDAIMFGKMVCYKQYPSVRMGLYLRLINLKDGKLVWAVDDVWDTTDRATAKRIKNFYFDFMRDTYDPAKGEMGLMSTDGFQKFVSYEILCTMDSSQQSATRPKFKFSRPVRRLGRHEKKTVKNILADF